MRTWLSGISSLESRCVCGRGRDSQRVTRQQQQVLHSTVQTGACLKLGTLSHSHWAPLHRLADSPGCLGLPILGTKLGCIEHAAGTWWAPGKMVLIDFQGLGELGTA